MSSIVIKLTPIRRRLFRKMGEEDIIKRFEDLKPGWAEYKFDKDKENNRLEFRYRTKQDNIEPEKVCLLYDILEKEADKYSGGNFDSTLYL